MPAADLHQQRATSSDSVFPVFNLVVRGIVELPRALCVQVNEFNLAAFSYFERDMMEDQPLILIHIPRQNAMDCVHGQSVLMCGLTRFGS